VKRQWYCWKTECQILSIVKFESSLCDQQQWMVLIKHQNSSGYKLFIHFNMYLIQFIWKFWNINKRKLTNSMWILWFFFFFSFVDYVFILLGWLCHWIFGTQCSATAQWSHRHRSSDLITLEDKTTSVLPKEIPSDSASHPHRTDTLPPSLLREFEFHHVTALQQYFW